MSGGASASATVAILRAGSVVGGGIFVVGLVLAGVRGNAAGPALAPAALLSGLVALEPRAWLSAAAITLIVTPAAGLLATAFECARTDRRSMLIAVLLVAILAASIAIAVLV
jgi:uncharacterized membrane protein